jgi:hypothetical protein
MIEHMFDTNTPTDLIVEPDLTGHPKVARLDALVLGEQAVRLEVLARIVELDNDRVWAGDGATSMADWLAGRYSLSIGTAREWVRVARALQEQPHIRRVFADGRLSWDQLRALIRFTTPEDEAEWAERAHHMSVAELRAVNKTVKSQDVVDMHERRSVEWWFDDHQPGFRMTVQMGNVEGATLATWLTRWANQYDPNPESGVYDPFETRCADALHQLASQGLAEDRDHDRATILIHTDLATLLNRIGTATIADGPALAHDTLRRLACDARLQLALTNPNGIIGVGRTTRSIPPWLQRLVRARDHGCRFPLCRRTRWTQIHHIVHWADGGPTDLNNLITLCGFHHRLIHEHQWTISGNPNGTITWHHPTGHPFQPQPPNRPLKAWKHTLSLTPPVQPPKRTTPTPTPLLR